eukprot:1136216-Amphidinium_carterae.3
MGWSQRSNMRARQHDFEGQNCFCSGHGVSWRDVQVEDFKRQDETEAVRSKHLSRGMSGGTTGVFVILFKPSRKHSYTFRAQSECRLEMDTPIAVNRVRVNQETKMRSSENAFRGGLKGSHANWVTTKTNQT